MNPEKLTREKGKRFYTMKPQLINKEGMLKLENHQWMLKLMCDFNTEENIYIVSKNFPTNYLLISWEKRNNFTVEKPGRHHPNQVIKLNIISIGTNQYHILHTEMCPEHNTTLCQWLSCQKYMVQI